MPDPTFADYLAARATLADAQFTVDGNPKMKHLNAALSAAGVNEITVPERDTFEAMGLDGAEPAPTGMVSVHIFSGPCNPVPVNVQGAGTFRLWHGQDYDIPEEAVGALENSNVKFTIKE